MKVGATMYAGVRFQVFSVKSLNSNIQSEPLSEHFAKMNRTTLNKLISAAISHLRVAREGAAEHGNAARAVPGPFTEQMMCEIPLFEERRSGDKEGDLHAVVLEHTHERYSVRNQYQTRMLH